MVLPSSVLSLVLCLLHLRQFGFQPRQLGNLETKGCLAPFGARTAWRAGCLRPAGLPRSQEIAQGWEPRRLGEERAMCDRPVGTQPARMCGALVLLGLPSVSSPPGMRISMGSCPVGAAGGEGKGCMTGEPSGGTDHNRQQSGGCKNEWAVFHWV